MGIFQLNNRNCQKPKNFNATTSYNTLMLDVVELLRSLYFWYLLPKTRVSSNHSTTKYVTFFKKGSSHVRFIATVCCCCSFWHWKIFASVIHCCPSSFFFQVPCRCRRQIELNFVQHILSKDRNHKSRRMWAQWARKYPFLYCNPQFCKWEKDRERKSDLEILSLQDSDNHYRSTHLV